MLLPPRLSRALPIVAVGIAGLSLVLSAVGWAFVPTGAEVLRHSSGATWSRSTALWAYPVVVTLFAAVGAWATPIGRRRDSRRQCGGHPRLPGLRLRRRILTTPPRTPFVN